MVSFLRRRLKGEGEGKGDGWDGGVFCYVNSVFAPGLDEGVGGLWRVSFFFFGFFVFSFGEEGGGHLGRGLGGFLLMGGLVF